ncbi:MAG: hypothetical protein K940chlam7_01682 [Chlamydiae bacterium]|nr:hypothetical protein [Chlamydiota bacterium]
MDRRLFEQLEAWKIKDRRKPLILMGARQVGKTFLLQQFAREKYRNHVYLNFEDTPALKKLFEESLQPKDILRNISIESNLKIEPGETLLIFDEIQECPSALNSLKYFCESANEYHICAAGSLLGVKLMHTKGFPVGKVDFLHLYPLGFFEFLQAVNETELYEYLQEYQDVTPLSEFLHDKLIRLFKVYMFVGGMPEAVANYIDVGNYSNVSEIHQAILNAYSLDFAKHAPKDQLMKISQVWDSIPGQLAKENKKFIYSVIRKGARAREYELAIQWLVEAGLIYKAYNVSTPKLPLEAYVNFEFFKIYLLDVGLLGAISHLSPKAIIDGNALFQEFRGASTENYVAQELVRSRYGLYYWTSAGKAELDFLIQHNDTIYPLEVKSGNSGRKKSLRVYGEQYHPKLLARTSPMNLRKDGDVLNCPLYLLSRLGCYLDRI